MPFKDDPNDPTKAVYVKPDYWDAFVSKELSFEDIQQIYKDAFGWEITNPKDNWVLLAREIEKRIKDAQKI